VVHENHARDHMSYNRFKEGNPEEREKQGVNLVDEESTDDCEAKICVAEWGDTPKSMSCLFLKPNTTRKEEIKYTFDVSKCDRLFDMLV
jgi:hypothetical protein